MVGRAGIEPSRWVCSRVHAGGQHITICHALLGSGDAHTTSSSHHQLIPICKWQEDVEMGSHGGADSGAASGTSPCEVCRGSGFRTCPHRFLAV